MSAKLLAWSAHFYTATGLVAAAVIAALLVRAEGESAEANFRWAFALMILATLIDATDGWWARRVGVRRHTPGFDGRRLDDIIDFHTYTSLPLLLVWRAGLLPPGWDWLAAVPLLASAYGFCQVSAKTDDGYFLGFPSYWNIIAFYLYVLNFEPWPAAGLLLGFSVLTFVPSRYLYPSQPGRLNRLATLLGVAWGAMLGAVSIMGWSRPLRSAEVQWVAAASLFYPAFYLLVSWGLSLRRVQATSSPALVPDRPTGSS